MASLGRLWKLGRGKEETDTPKKPKTPPAPKTPIPITMPPPAPHWLFQPVVSKTHNLSKLSSSSSKSLPLSRSKMVAKATLVSSADQTLRRRPSEVGRSPICIQCQVAMDLCRCFGRTPTQSSFATNASFATSTTSDVLHSPWPQPPSASAFSTNNSRHAEVPEATSSQDEFEGPARDNYANETEQAIVPGYFCEHRSGLSPALPSSALALSTTSPSGSKTLQDSTTIPSEALPTIHTFPPEAFAQPRTLRMKRRPVPLALPSHSSTDLANQLAPPPRTKKLDERTMMEQVLPRSNERLQALQAQMKQLAAFPPAAGPSSPLLLRSTSLTSSHSLTSSNSWEDVAVVTASRTTFGGYSYGVKKPSSHFRSQSENVGQSLASNATMTRLDNPSSSIIRGKPRPGPIAIPHKSHSTRNLVPFNPTPSMASTLSSSNTRRRSRSVVATLPSATDLDSTRRKERPPLLRNTSLKLSPPVSSPLKNQLITSSPAAAPESGHCTPASFPSTPQSARLPDDEKEERRDKVKELDSQLDIICAEASKVVRQLKRTSRKLLSCGRPGCFGYLEYSRGTPKVICYSCESAFCVSCETTWHAGISCQDFAEHRSRLSDKESLRRLRGWTEGTINASAVKRDPDEASAQISESANTITPPTEPNQRTMLPPDARNTENTSHSAGSDCDRSEDEDSN